MTISISISISLFFKSVDISTIDIRYRYIEQGYPWCNWYSWAPPDHLVADIIIDSWAWQPQDYWSSGIHTNPHRHHIHQYSQHHWKVWMGAVDKLKLIAVWGKPPLTAASFRLTSRFCCIVQSDKSIFEKNALFKQTCTTQKLARIFKTQEKKNFSSQNVYKIRNISRIGKLP